jgi:hypothetical protein
MYLKHQHVVPTHYRQPHQIFEEDENIRKTVNSLFYLIPLDRSSGEGDEQQGKASLSFFILKY